MMTVTQALTVAAIAIALSVAALVATSPADAAPRGVRTLSGTDLGSGRKSSGSQSNPGTSRSYRSR